MAENWMLKAVLSANADGMLKTLKSVNTATSTTRKYLLDVAKSAGNLGAQVGMPLGLISGALGAFSIAGMKNAVLGFAELTGQISDSAKGVMLSAEEYQRLTFIAGQSSISAEAMGESIGRLNKNIDMAAHGKNKDLAALFKHSGIAMRDAAGNIRNGADLLPEVADLFARNKDETRLAAIGTELFGKSWRQLAPMLVDGKAGIDQLTARYKELGLVIDNDAVAAGEAFGDQVDQLKQVVQSYGNTITSKLLPALSPLIEQTIQWAVKNKELISTNVSKFVTELAADLSKVDWSGVAQGAREFVDGLKWCVDAVGGTKNALIGLVIFMNINTIAAFAGLVGAIGRGSYAFMSFAIKAIPKVLGALGLLPFEMGAAALATDGLTASTKAADLAAAGWVKNLKSVASVLGSIGLAAAPLVAMWGVKEWAEDQSNDVSRIEGIQGFGSMFGFNRDDEIEAIRQKNRAELGGDLPSLVTPAQKIGGEIKVSFDNAPPGMRVMPPTQSGPVVFKTDMGYRSAATGMPY